MAECRGFVCEHCSFSIGAWADGNPYYIDEMGKKQYAYHPQQELELCIGNDSPYLCLDCGKQTMIDSRSPDERCGECESTNMVGLFHLGGRPCPACRIGLFCVDPKIIGIS